MGKTDICVDYFFQDLIDNGFQVSERKFNTDILDVSPVNSILKVGDVYAGMITENENELDDIKRIMIFPFVKGLCRGKNIDLKFAKESVFRDSFLFFVGYSKLNFCKILAFSTANFTVKNL